MNEVEKEHSEEDIKNVLTQIKEEQDEAETIDKKELIRFEGKVKYLQIRPVPTSSYNENNKKFTCDICKKGVGTKGGLIYHMKAHINGRPFKCDICHRSYATKNDFDTHFKRHAGITYKCDLCEKSYQVKQYLADHVIKLHFPKIIPCSQCKRKFATKAILKTHVNFSHLKTKSKFIYECKLCGMKFAKNKAYIVHCEDREKLKYECVICAKKFPCYKLMIEHRKQEDRANFCNICQIKVTSINMHSYQFHKTRICNFCKTFSTDNSNLFASHREKCGSEEKIALLGHPCEVCNEKFATKFKLNQHCNKAHGKLKCQICFKLFFTEVSMKIHYKHHKRQKHHMSLLYRCILCPEPKNFSSRLTFDRHFKNQHSTANRILDGCIRKVGRLVCDKCRGRSRSNDQLLKHILECYNIEPPRHNQQRNVNFKPRFYAQVKTGPKMSFAKGKAWKRLGPVRPMYQQSVPAEKVTEIRHLRNREITFSISD